MPEEVERESEINGLLTLSLTHSLTPSLPHSLIHSPTHSRTYSLTHPPTLTHRPPSRPPLTHFLSSTLGFRSLSASPPSLWCSPRMSFTCFASAGFTRCSTSGSKMVTRPGREAAPAAGSPMPESERGIARE